MALYFDAADQFKGEQIGQTDQRKGFTISDIDEGEQNHKNSEGSFPRSGKPTQ